jgi:hypothetical protein
MLVRNTLVALLLVSLPVVVSCGSSHGSRLLSTSAGYADSGPGAAGRAPPPDAAGSGLADIQFTMRSTVAPGSEAQSCLLVQMPTDRGPMAVPSAESHFTPGSHHFLAYRTSLTSIPDDAGGLLDCMEPTGGVAAKVVGSYFEAQQPDMKHDLPKGVAHIFQPGEVLVLQTHYLNPSDASIDARVTFTLHTTDPAGVEHEAGSILFSNSGLSVLPRAKTTQTRTCPVSDTSDMNLLLLWSHMHKQGVRFVVTTDDAAIKGTLYETDVWSEPQPHVFSNDPPTTVHAGSHITVSCDYDNPTDRTLLYGPSAATNEMCILHGMYWPRVDPVTEFCLRGTSP